MQDLIKELKKHLLEEYEIGDWVFSDKETCEYFRNCFKKQPPPAPPTPKIMPKIDKPPPPVISTPKVDHSDFKKLMSEHFPNLSIIDP